MSLEGFYFLIIRRTCDTKLSLHIIRLFSECAKVALLRMQQGTTNSLAALENVRPSGTSFASW